MAEELKAKAANRPLRVDSPSHTQPGTGISTRLKAAAKIGKILILEPLGNLQKYTKTF